MKNTVFFLFVFCSQLSLFANDGAYYASGNHLVPISETAISIRKEVLTIRKVNDKAIEVTVYYEFFNPGKEKELVVGFEAFSPSGDVNGTPKKGLHPYMRDFTVSLNSTALRYDVAYVSDSLYAQSGKIVSRKLGDVLSEIDNTNEVNFYYVYHFKANFKSGLNIVRHTYTYDLSGSVDEHYSFDYILTAANRWANKGIDDFTLIVDMGEFESFHVAKSFFGSAEDWDINGIGKAEDAPPRGYDETKDGWLKFTVRNGDLLFRQLHFTPKGELMVYSPNYFSADNFTIEETLPFSVYLQDAIGEPDSELAKKILRNLPFARRGYVFSNEALSDYYMNRTDWYLPDPAYVPDATLLWKEEQEWIKKWE